MKAFLFLCCLAGGAVAGPAPDLPSLLPGAELVKVLEQDPEVLAAAAALDLATQQARALEQSPYEWTVRASGQRRSVDPGAVSNEWNTGLERTLRLPAKGKADRQIAAATFDQGWARYRMARRAAARSLIEAWLEWQSAQQQQMLAAAQQGGAKGIVAAVDKRIRAGDASQLDASLARAELAEQQRLENEAKTAATVAAVRIHARFPGLPASAATMEAPVPISQSAQELRQRMMEANVTLRDAQTQLLIAKGQQERASAERLPDPTVGIYTGREARGQERITSISLSIPIPGPQRGTRAGAASATAEMTRQEVELRRRELDANVAALLATADGSYAGWQIAQAGAAEMRDNARLMQRAYALGEVDLQALLSAGRLATAAEQTALAARTSALRAYWAVMLEANLLWEDSVERVPALAR